MISQVYFSSYLMLLYQTTLRLVAHGTERLERFLHLGHFQFARYFVIAVLQLGSCNFMNCVLPARRSFRKKLRKIYLTYSSGFQKIHLKFIWAEKHPIQYRFWYVYDSCRRTKWRKWRYGSEQRFGYAEQRSGSLCITDLNMVSS